MTLLTVASLPSAGPPRMHEALVPRSKPTRMRLRSPRRTIGAVSVERSNVAEVAAGRSATAAVGFFSSVGVGLVMFFSMLGGGLAVQGRNQACARALGRQHGVEQIGNDGRTGGARRLVGGRSGGGVGRGRAHR